MNVAGVCQLEICPQLGLIGDWFNVEGTTEDQRSVIEGSGDWLHGVGTGMHGGTLIVEGDVGDNLGRRMLGGTIVIHGNVASSAGSGMRNGSIHICGNAGDNLGGPWRGERTGMRGGMITVGGECGQRMGHRMRRGMIMVSGHVASQMAWDMIAGTIVVGGATEEFGFGMRRGTIVLAESGIVGKASCSLREPMAVGRFSGWLPAGGEILPLLFAEIGRGWGAHSNAFSEREPQNCGSLRDLGEGWRERQWLRSRGDRAVGGQGEVFGS